MNLDWPALETERLILRPWKPEDFEPYARFSADEESMRYLRREERAPGGLFVVVGRWKPKGWPDLEIGWAVDRSRWGRGYATEAARAAADWVHRTPGAGRGGHFIHERTIRHIPRG